VKSFEKNTLRNWNFFLILKLQILWTINKISNILQWQLLLNAVKTNHQNNPISFLRFTCLQIGSCWNSSLLIPSSSCHRIYFTFFCWWMLIIYFLQRIVNFDQTLLAPFISIIVKISMFQLSMYVKNILFLPANIYS